MLRSFVCSKNEIGLLWFDNAASEEGGVLFYDSKVVGINWAAQFVQQDNN